MELVDILAFVIVVAAGVAAYAAWRRSVVVRELRAASPPGAMVLPGDPLEELVGPGLKLGRDPLTGHELQVRVIDPHRERRPANDTSSRRADSSRWGDATSAGKTDP